MKWMKLAGYFAIISFIIIFIFGLISFFQVSGFNFYKHLFKIIISFFLFLGFLTLGRFSKNKFLINIAWIILFLSLTTSVFSIIILTNPFILLYPVINFDISISLNTFLLILLPFGVMSIFNILLGVSLLNVKKVKFVKATGIFAIIIGIFYSIFYLILAPIALYSSETSWFHQFFSNSSIFIVEAVIITFFWAIFTFFESMMFFDASKNFEK